MALGGEHQADLGTAEEKGSLVGVSKESCLVSETALEEGHQADLGPAVEEGSLVGQCQCS